MPAHPTDPRLTQGHPPRAGVSGEEVPQVTLADHAGRDYIAVPHPRHTREAND
ncbi:MAG: hypothetical protein GSR78_05405 [Desulfurococcales archaeon]|nr:hypothetical protein [Desulfurococcales archaeon]